MRSPRTFTARLTPAIVAFGLLVASAAPVSAANPHDVADARFAAMNGPLAQFVVTPDKFGIDATKVLTDIPPLLDQVDKANLVTDTTALADMFRSSHNDQSNLDSAANFVKDKFTSMGYDPEIMNVTHDGKSMPNISVTIPGTGCSNKVLSLSAHYDAAGATNPGADDDASAMAGLFEIARILRDHPQPVTIRLVAYSFEEDGLIGSFAMADREAAAGLDLMAAISMDMIGYTDASKTDPFVGLPQDYLAMVADPTSAEIARTFGAAVYTYLPEFPAAAAVIDPKLMSDIFRSDHAPYVLKGYQGMMVTDTANFRNPNYHTPNDTLDTLNWDFVTNSTRAVLAGMLTASSSDQNADGVADACGAAPHTPSTTTPPTTAPTTAPSSTVPAVAPRPGRPGSQPTPVAAPTAAPVAAQPAYTG